MIAPAGAYLVSATRGPRQPRQLPRPGQPPVYPMPALPGTGYLLPVTRTWMAQTPTPTRRHSASTWHSGTAASPSRQPELHGPRRRIRPKLGVRPDGPDQRRRPERCQFLVASDAPTQCAAPGCPADNPGTSGNRPHVPECPDLHRRQYGRPCLRTRPSRRLGVRYSQSLLSGRRAPGLPAKEPIQSQRRPTSGDNQLRQATVKPGQVPTERH